VSLEGGEAVSKAGSDEKLPDEFPRRQAEIAELRRSRRRLLEAADADRRGIERALHDGVQQQLVSLAVDLQRVARLVDQDPPAAKALLDEMATHLRDALSESTELARTIYPPRLDRRGFATALRTAAERTGVTVLVDAPAAADYSPEISSAVYWSCVEAMACASPGSQVTVSMPGPDDLLTVEVAVAGRDLTASLERLRDRIEALGGRVTVDEGKLGSRVQGWLPLSR
jgi:signal transduction histidine kinase